MQHLFATPDYLERIDMEGAAQGAQPHERGLVEQGGLGVMRGGAQVARSIGIAAGALVLPFGEDVTDDYFEVLDDTLTDAVDYWTPDPRTTTTAGRIVAGLAEAALPLMVGAGSPVPLMLDSAMRSAERVADQDAGPIASAAVGTLDAAAIAAGFAIPAVGRTLARSLALGVASNPAIGAATEAAQRTLLEAAGADQAAQQFDPFDLERRGIETLLGLAFGGIAHGLSRRLGTAERDALLTYRNAADIEARAPGQPVSLRSRNAHEAALRETLAAQAEGRPSSALSTLDGAQFDVTPAQIARQRQAEAAVRPVLDEITVDTYDTVLPRSRRAEAQTAREDIARGAVALDEHPDVTIALDDGVVVKGREAMADAYTRLVAVPRLRRAIETAIACQIQRG
ncbi:MAG: hypothetical protein AB7Q01_14660 [Gammaproteobacteria bacterium]